MESNNCFHLLWLFVSGVVVFLWILDVKSTFLLCIFIIHGNYYIGLQVKERERGLKEVQKAREWYHLLGSKLLNPGIVVMVPFLKCYLGWTYLHCTMNWFSKFCSWFSLVENIHVSTFREAGDPILGAWVSHYQN